MFYIRSRPGKILWFSSILTFCCGELTSCRHNVLAPAPVTSNRNPVTLPAGSVLAVRTAETIDSEQPKLDRAYAAVVSRDLKGAETQTVLPSGSPVTLVLFSPAGIGGNGGSWQLGLSSVMINGNSLLVRNGGTGSVDRPASMSQDSAGLLGTFLGGVPGTFYTNLPADPLHDPSKLTVSGTSIEISSGSLLTFRLREDIILVGSR